MNEQGEREFIPLSPKGRADVNEALEKGGVDYLVDISEEGLLKSPDRRILEWSAYSILHPFIPDPRDVPDSSDIAKWGFLEKPTIAINWNNQKGNL